MQTPRDKFFSGLFIKKSWIRLDLGVYWFWAAVRVFITLLPQTGYIHPDEYFQTVEVAAGDVFGTTVSLPWEFNTTFPIRSIPIIHLTIHIPLVLVRIASEFLTLYTGIHPLNPYTLLIIPRLSMTLLSFLSDWCLFRICYIYGQNYKERLILFASSFVCLIFMTRTFTNTLEIACFNILLFLVASCMAESEKINFQNGYLKTKYKEASTIADRVKIIKLMKLLPKHSLRRCFPIAVVTVAGFFNRPTFLFFAISPLFYWFQRGLQSQTSFLKDFHVRIIVFSVYCFPVFCFFIFADSVYYGYLTWGEVLSYRVNFNNFVITPWNFLKYNMDSANLAKHGLHPRFLHVLVNFPLLFNVLGLSGLLVICKMFYRGSLCHWSLLPKSQSITGMMTLSLISPLLLLSIFPHQEPRFISPVLLPLVFLYSHLLTDCHSDQTTLAPFRKRHPPPRTPSPNPILEKCYNLITKTTERFENRFNIIERHLAKKPDVVSFDDSFETPPETETRKNLCALRLWYFFNFISLLFFGFFHQGGVFPLCKHFHKEILHKAKYTNHHLMTSHTYSLPHHLLILKPRQPNFFIYELGSENFENIHLKLITILKVSEAKKTTKNINYKVYYTFPMTLYNEFTFSHKHFSSNYSFSIENIFYPHFSGEALPNLFLNVSKAPDFGFLDEGLFRDVWRLFPVRYLHDFFSQFGLILIRARLQ